MQLRRFFVFLFSLAPFWASQAQQVTPPATLPEIEVSEIEVRANRNDLYSTGSRTSSADSLLKQLYPHGSVADVLRQLSPVYIKNYGVSNLASVSVRGTTSNQTALVWNGIQINTPSNGINDFSLVPAAMAQSLQLSHGPMSALYGSGAVGGTLLLTSWPVPANGHGLQFAQTVGSFGKLQSLVSGTYGGKKWQGKSSVQYSEAQNNFPFINEFSPTRRKEYTPNAAFSQQHFSQDLFFYPTEKLSISVHGWALRSERQIPPVMGVPVSRAEQEDRANRLAAIVRKQHANGNSTLRIAYLNDFLAYKNPTININTPGQARTNTWLTEAEHRINIKSVSLNGGAQIRRIVGEIKEYGRDVEQYQQALFASVRYNINPKAVATLSARKEFVTGFDPDPTFSLGTELQMAKNGALQLKTQIANSFRVPTLNERYWQPGGNPNLRPERGLSAEAGLSWQPQNERLILRKTEITIYNSVIENMIVWRPVTGMVYAPQNLEQVWARGAELSSELKYNLLPQHKLSLRARGAYAYTLSTQINNKNRALENKQLMYVPVHSATLFASVHHAWLNIGWQQSFSGKLYTTTDNLGSLNAYSVADLLIWSPEVAVKKLQFNVTAVAKNLFDTPYQTVVNMPMPGRHYELRLNINIPNTSTNP